MTCYKKKKSVLWDLITISEAESMATMAGSMAVGRLACHWKRAKCLQPGACTAERETGGGERERYWGLGPMPAFKTPKPTLKDTCPPTKPNHLVLPKPSHQLKKCIQTHKPMGTILIPATTMKKYKV